MAEWTRSMKNKAIQNLRKKIDSLDERLLQLLDERMEIVSRIGAEKIKTGENVYHPEREKVIIERLSALKPTYLNHSAIEAIFLEIFAISRNLEMPERVAFLGPIGSYAHQAAEERFGAMSEYLPVCNISSVFDAVVSKRAKYGVVPLENNINGIVGESVDCLILSDLKIFAEIILPIHHTFSSKEFTLREIQRIYSKDIAFGQCKTFLHAHQLEEIEWVPVESTARAAQIVQKEKKSAAICSKIAAKLYNIPTMFENIEDSNKNKTRFIVVGDFTSRPSQRDKTSIFAKLKDHNRVGALQELLEDFKAFGINLTKIDSRPVASDNFDFGFYIDFLGHRDDENVKKFFQKQGNNIKWLGSYVREI